MTSSILLLQEETSVWRTAERERRKPHTCHISSSIHATFTVTHTKGEESVRWGGGGSGCRARARRPAVGWKAEEDAMVGAGPGPAAAAALSLS